MADALVSAGINWMTRAGIDANTANGDFGAYIGRRRNIAGAGVAAVWEAGELIRDPYSKAASGQVSLTLSSAVEFRPPPRRSLPSSQVRHLRSAEAHAHHSRSPVLPGPANLSSSWAACSRAMSGSTYTRLWAALGGHERGPDGRYPHPKGSATPWCLLTASLRNVALSPWPSSASHDGYVTTASRDEVPRLEQITKRAGGDNRSRRRGSAPSSGGRLG